ncbi:MAG: DUF3696 domain-containing protein [Desulfomonile tiedjei]|nr:DUF3696 domain-containing protein [Desulfomonile tiedjei]
MPRKSSTEKKLQDESPKSITAITVGGFKSLCKKQALEIRPLTILAGANSSGKSSFMQPLLLMKQTLESKFEPAGALRLDGPNVEFSSVDQLLCREGERGYKNAFSVRLQVDSESFLEDVFERKPDREHFDIKQMTWKTRGRKYTLRPGVNEGEIAAEAGRLLGAEFEKLSERSSHKVSWSILPYGFLGPALVRWQVPTQKTTRGEQRTTIIKMEPSVTVDSLLRGLIHLPAVRGTRERSYPSTAVGPTFPGTFEQYVASLVDYWQASKDNKIIRLAEALEDLRLTWKVEARRIDSTRFELLVGRPRRRPSQGADKDLVNIADVGSGVPHVLPVLAALIEAVPSQMVFVEEPECHLHPRSQIGLARHLAAAAKRGVRIIAETHSSLLLLGIQTLVAEGKLSPDLVKLHWFERDRKGFTKITSTNLDSAGRFETEWPEDFGDVELEAQSDYLDASAKRQMGL